MQKGAPAPEITKDLKKKKLQYLRIDWKPVKIKTRDIVNIEPPPDTVVGESDRIVWVPTVRKDGYMSVLKVFK